VKEDLLCGRQSCQQAAFQAAARLWLFWHALGRVVWQAIVPAGGLSGRRRTDHSRSSHEFLGLRRFSAGEHEAGEIPSCKSSCARLDKLKHVLQRRRRHEYRRCRHECPRHVRSNGSLAQMAKAERPARLDRMWGRMASGGRLVIGLSRCSSLLVARSAMLTARIGCPTRGRIRAAGFTSFTDSGLKVRLLARLPATQLLEHA
jgi:hypothetical protein